MTDERARDHCDQGRFGQQSKGDCLRDGRILADAVLHHVWQYGYDEADQEDVGEECGGHGHQYERR